jgi:hypothetical protein
MRITGVARGGGCYREALLAMLVVGALFSTAHEADAKLRVRHRTQIPHSHPMSVARPGPAQRFENQMPGDIYDSLSGATGTGAQRRRAAVEAALCREGGEFKNEQVDEQEIEQPPSEIAALDGFRGVVHLHS